MNSFKESRDEQWANNGLVRVFSGVNGDELSELPGPVANSGIGRGLAAVGNVDGSGTDEIVVGVPALQGSL